MSLRWFFLTPLLCLLTAGLASAQTTWFVDGSGLGPGDGTLADPYVTIQSALDAPSTVDGDLISVAPGTYVELIQFGGKSLYIEGQMGPEVTILQAPPGNAPTLVSFEGADAFSTGLRNLTLYGGDATNPTGTFSPWGSGGALEYCVVRGFAVGCNNLYDLIVDNCTFVENDAAIYHFGGGHGADAITNIENGLFWNNIQDITGQGLGDGGFWAQFTLFNTDPLFVNSTATDYHIGVGSPAIDTGASNLTDPDGSRSDIGAFAYDPAWPIGTSYCTANANSTGLRGRIWVTGTANLQAANLLVHADRMPANKLAVLFHGVNRDLAPLAEGVRCTSAPIERVFLFQTSNAGTFGYNYDAANPPQGVAPLVPGDVRNLQVWFRDPVGGVGGSNLTNAVEVRFRP